MTESSQEAMYSTFGRIVLLRAYGICEYENQNKLAPNPWRNDPIPHPINTEPLRQALKTGPAPSSSINIALIAARPAPTSSPTNSPSGCRNPSTESTVQGSNCRIEEASTTGATGVLNPCSPAEGEQTRRRRRSCCSTEAPVLGVSENS
jgi:hypothetical protein